MMGMPTQAEVREIKQAVLFVAAAGVVLVFLAGVGIGWLVFA